MPGASCASRAVVTSGLPAQLSLQTERSPQTLYLPYCPSLTTCTYWDLQVSLRGKVDLPPDEVFDILVDEDNHKVFKAIKARRPRSKGACSCASDSAAGSFPQLKAPTAAGRGVQEGAAG